MLKVEDETIYNMNCINEFEPDTTSNYINIIEDNKIIDAVEDIFPFKSMENEFKDFNNMTIKEANIINKNIRDCENKKEETVHKTKNNKNVLLGRKRKDDNKKRNHDKYSFDNLLRKIKHNLLESFRRLVNEKIKTNYEKENISSMELIKINQEQADNIKVDYNKIFIKKSLKDIFSVDTTTKNLCGQDHNKILIEKLLEEKDDIEINVFVKLFNFQFLDLIKYVIGEKEGLDELEGLTLPNNLRESLLNDKEYENTFYYTLKNLEKLLDERKSRKRGKKLFNLITKI